jgi:flagellar biosynthesis protein FlhB
VIIFGSIQFLLKKNNQTEFFFFKKSGSNWFGSVLAQFFPVWLGFFLVWLVFSGFSSVWVRFGFFGFRLIKPKLNRTGWFFQNFNRFFFSQFSFFVYLFLFSRFNRFFDLFAHPRDADRLLFFLFSFSFPFQSLNQFKITAIIFFMHLL